MDLELGSPFYLCKEPDLMEQGPSWIGVGGGGGVGLQNFKKAMYVRRLKMSFGSNPWANRERFFGMGSFDMKDTLSMSCPVL
jgi:hypothetical protein